METRNRRFRRTYRAEQASRDLRPEILAVRHELELLHEVMRTGPTPVSARAALDRAFFALRAAERAWRESRLPGDLATVATQLDASREALRESLDALARRTAASHGR